MNLLVETFLFVCVFFLNKKYIFSYTFDLCGWVGDKNFFTRSIFGNKTTFLALYFLFSFALVDITYDRLGLRLSSKKNLKISSLCCIIKQWAI